MRKPPRKKEKRNYKGPIAALVVLAVAAIGFFLFIRLEGTPPVFSPTAPLVYMGAEGTFSGTFTDPGSGLARIQVLAFAPGKKENVILDETLAPKGFLRSGKETERPVSLTIKPSALGISEGPAVIAVRAEDYSLRRWGRGNLYYQEFPVKVDTRGPVISMLTREHYVNQGGTGLAIWKVSEPVQKDGVQVGDHFYPAYSGRFSDPEIHIAFFAVTPDQGTDTPIRVTARDLAGNTGSSSLYHRIRAKAFRTDDLTISDKFIEQIIPGIETSKPLSPDLTPLDRFLAINRDQRQADFRAIVAAEKETEKTALWNGTFSRLPGAAPRAGFGDKRNYIYNGEAVDHQVHLGVDLASLARSPVPAANSGKVAFAGNIGIYGQTVMLDHGFGLYSTYSHLSQISVNAGQAVNKDEIIGVTGESGLAGGDHLHFAVLVQDNFVDPKEWWDPSWIKNNVTSKIQAVEESLKPLPPAASPEAAAPATPAAPTPTADKAPAPAPAKAPAPEKG